jgi:hypothetical protein
MKCKVQGNNVLISTAERQAGLNTVPFAKLPHIPFDFVVI